MELEAFARRDPVFRRRKREIFAAHHDERPVEVIDRLRAVRRPVRGLDRHAALRLDPADPGLAVVVRPVVGGQGLGLQHEVAPLRPDVSLGDVDLLVAPPLDDAGCLDLERLAGSGGKVEFEAPCCGGSQKREYGERQRLHCDAAAGSVTNCTVERPSRRIRLPPSRTRNPSAWNRPELPTPSNGPSPDAVLSARFTKAAWVRIA